MLASGLGDSQTSQQATDEQRGYLPLQVKWTAIMAAVVAVAMAVSSVLVFRAQSEALTRQAIDSGMSLARFIAVQTAIPVLGEDWVILDALVVDAAARGTFRYLIVADHEGIVRSASDDTPIGSPWEPTGVQREVLSSDDGSRAQELEQVFNFRLPVLFNETVVGRVDLGVDRAPLEAALGTTKRILVVLAFAIVLAVSLVIYIFTKLIARNLKLATSALNRLGAGQLETRISRQRGDEFGDLFYAVNHLADGIEKPLEGAASTEGSLHDSPGADEELDVMGAMRGALSEEWLTTGSGLLESDLEAAISALEKSLRYNPGNRDASLRLQQARTMQRKLRRTPGS